MQNKPILISDDLKDAIDIETVLDVSKSATTHDVPIAKTIPPSESNLPSRNELDFSPALDLMTWDFPQFPPKTTT